MLDELTIEANEESFQKINQYSHFFTSLPNFHYQDGSDILCYTSRLLYQVRLLFNGKCPSLREVVERWCSSKSEI